MDNQLAEIMERRRKNNSCGDVEIENVGKNYTNSSSTFNPFTSFPDLGRKKIKDYEKIFKAYDNNKKGYLDLEDCKKLMEYLGKPQTHLNLKRLINESDKSSAFNNPVNTLSFYGFLSLLQSSNEDNDLADGIKNIADISDINVSETGVSGAKTFFTAKIIKQNQENKAEYEIKKEQESRKKEIKEAQQRKSSFKNRINMFNNTRD